MSKNWRTTWSGIAAAAMSALTMLAALPYTLGDVALLIPPEWKAKVVTVGIVASFVLRVIQSRAAADASR